MIWRKLNATFGKLENRTLVLEEGLNFIHAPNESGKSTWCAFLRTMLYGFPARSRGALADKNRYAPWSGSPMQGSMEIEQDGQRLTISRRTARANSPMGAFSAAYTDTATPVEGLTAANCGEVLLGIPREVFERSAFIRQAGIPIDQDAELERRIAALITTGEEDTSFSQSYERLKKQLNSRRYNKSGQLPQLEGEIAALEETLRQAEALQREARSQEALIPQLESQEQQLSAALDRALAEQALLDSRRAQAEARNLYSQAKAQLAQQRQETTRLAQAAAALPSRERLIELKSAVGSITVNELSRRQLEGQLSQRRQAEAEARQALAPYAVFAGSSAPEAQQKAQRDSAEWQRWTRSGRRWPLCLAAALACLALATLAVGLLQLPWAGAALGAGGLVLLVVSLLCRRNRQRAGQLAAPYSARSAEDFSALARSYTTLYEIWDARRQEADTVQRRLEDLADNIQRARAKLLEELRPFAPGTEELPAAAEAVDRALRHLRALEDARAALDRLEAKCEALAAALPPEPASAASSAPSGQDVPALRARLSALRQQLTEARQTLAACQGQLRSLGDFADLQAQLEERQALHTQRQEEYDAIALAMEVLSQANTALQNRFSPALGEKAAGIFTKLTRGKYNKVLLDRELAASALESGSSVPREALVLSQGAADQLYLAVRLAICDMVLPKEKAIPLVLDDALTSFDDDRCAAALDYLMELSRERQILLFSCQEREGAYLRRTYPGQFHDVPLLS